MNTLLVADNLPNLVLANTKNKAQPRLRPFARCVQISDGKDLGRGQLHAPIIFPKQSALSPFPNHVGHVVGTGANKQMGRVTTLPVVAPMANEHPRRDGAGRKDVRDTVSGNSFTIKAEVPISVWADTPDERPTSVRPAALVNLGPESFGRGGLKYPASMVPFAEHLWDAGVGAILRDCGLNPTATATVTKKGVHMRYIVSRKQYVWRGF